MLDISNSIGAIDWGESYLPILSDQFRAWEARNVYMKAVDLNPPLGKLAAKIGMKCGLPATFHAGVGAVIGSFRSALDLLMASSTNAKGVALGSNVHFPFFGSPQDMVDPKTGIESKKWLSAAEQALIKSFRPYKGGDDLLWSLHQLDILRKHKRLIACFVQPRIDYAIGRDLAFPEHASGALLRLEDQPIMFEWPRDAPKPEAQFSTKICFHETALPAVDGEELLITLDRLSSSAREIVIHFEHIS